VSSLVTSINQEKEEVRKTTGRMSKTTPQNARKVFLSAASTFAMFGGGQSERQQRLLDILQNNNIRDVLQDCLNENDAIAAFTRAASENCIDIVQAFHDVGMNMDIKDQHGKCALIEAIETNTEDCVRWLLDHDANANIQDNDGSTALIYASTGRSSSIVEMLLQKNANIDTQNKEGDTALMLACNRQCISNVQVLLNSNADVKLMDKKGRTALDLTNHVGIKELLRNHVSSSYVLK
jgi:ankyrin repeat protein